MRPIRLNLPKPVRVICQRGVPGSLDGTDVETVREQWLVEEGWWEESPVSRRYFELLLCDGRIEVVFCDLESGRWFSQRA